MTLTLNEYKKLSEIINFFADASLHPRNRTKSIINFMIVWCAVFVIIHMAIKIPLIFPPFPHFCSVYHRIKIISFALATICCYFTLWYRVFTVFYKNKSMRKNISKILHVVVLLPFILLFLMVVTNLTIFLSGPAQENIDCGCRAVQEKTQHTLKWAILVFWIISFQGTLLFSFIYPLYLHRKKMISRGLDHELIISVVKRAAIVAVVCVVSDLMNSAFAIMYKGETVYLNHIVISTNLLINLMGALMSFSNWKEKMFPWRKQNEDEEVSKLQRSLEFNTIKQIKVNS